MGIRIVNNIPAAEVDAQEQLARDTGATDVRRVPETDGEFTLFIFYPDQERFGALAARLADPGGADGG